MGITSNRLGKSTDIWGFSNFYVGVLNPGQQSWLKYLIDQDRGNDYLRILLLHHLTSLARMGIRTRAAPRTVLNHSAFCQNMASTNHPQFYCYHLLPLLYYW